MKNIFFLTAVVALVAALQSPPAFAQEQPAHSPPSRDSSPPPSPPPSAPPPSTSAPSAPSGSSRGGDAGGGFRSGSTGDDGGSRARGGRDGSGEFRGAVPRGRIEPSHVGGPDGADRTERRRAPDYSRPRGDNTVVGEAVPRGTVPRRDRPGSGGGGTAYIFDPYDGFYGGYGGYGGFGGSRYGYSAYGWPYYVGAFGLGYFYYDPFWWSYPYYGGYSGYGAPVYGGYGGYGGGGYVSETGGLRLKVKPRHAKVFVNGYFEGYVDNFDGILQKLKLRPGPNRIEVRADGFEAVVFDVNSIPGETITYKADLRPIP